MTERHEREEFRDRIIDQDAGITEAGMREQRQRVEERLLELEARAWKSRQFTVRAVLTVVVCYLMAIPLQAAQSAIWGKEIIMILWTVCSWSALVVAAVALTRYWTIHRPQLDRGRVDLQVALFKELQREIAELKRNQ